MLLHPVHRRLALVLALLLFGAPYSMADDSPKIDSAKVLVLDFELNDLTLYPDIAEQKRVASLRPLLGTKLVNDYEHRLMELAQQLRDEADKGKGYLFDRPQVVAKLGVAAEADWVITGRLHKPSFLFVYLKAQLIEVSSASVKADFVVEIKGNAPRLTEKGVDALALQIDESLAALYVER